MDYFLIMEILIKISFRDSWEIIHIMLLNGKKYRLWCVSTVSHLKVRKDSVEEG